MLLRARTPNPGVLDHFYRIPLASGARDRLHHCRERTLAQLVADVIVGMNTLLGRTCRGVSVYESYNKTDMTRGKKGREVSRDRWNGAITAMLRTIVLEASWLGLRGAE